MTELRSHTSEIVAVDGITRNTAFISADAWAAAKVLADSKHWRKAMDAHFEAAKHMCKKCGHPSDKPKGKRYICADCEDEK